jgi:capsid protein
MSHRSAKAERRAARAPAGTPLADEPNVQRMAVNTPLGGFGWGQGYNAADQSTMRGFVYFPQLDTRRELTTYTRTEILRRARYLDANVGFAGRIINGIARMVAGTGLMVRPSTTDRDWNRERRALYERRNGTAAAFDVGRRWDVYSSQRGSLRCRYRDGDIGGAFSRSEAGFGQVAFYESHRINSGRVSTDQINRIFDGVLVDRNNAAVAYRVTGDNDSQVDIPAASFFYLGDYSSPGKHRTPSILHRACNHMLDITEINAATKKGIKLSNQIGYYIGQGAQSSGGNIPPMGEGANPKQLVELPDGTKRTLEQLLTQGGEIPGLPPGAEIKQLLDQRPHPNSQEFLKTLARDISWGTDLAPEILWDIAALGGANIRYVMADAQSFVEVEQQGLVDAYLARHYIWDTALEIAAGRIRKPRDPEWMKHAVITPARWTVDRGRDGKLHLEEMRSGALTFRRYLGWQGLDFEEEAMSWLDEMQFWADEAKKRGLDPAFVLDRIYARVGVSSPTDRGEPGADSDKETKPLDSAA